MTVWFFAGMTVWFAMHASQVAFATWCRQSRRNKPLSGHDRDIQQIGRRQTGGRVRSCDRSWRGQRSPGAPPAPTVRFTKIARFQHGESAEGRVNTELACCPDSRGGRRPPRSPCPPRFLRAENLAALRRQKRRRHPGLHVPTKLRKVELRHHPPPRGARTFQRFLEIFP
jgi:hypothetical protein